MLLSSANCPRFELMDMVFVGWVNESIAGLPEGTITDRGAFRTQGENKAVGGVANSLHMQGQAIDISWGQAVKPRPHPNLDILYYPLKNYYHFEVNKFGGSVNKVSFLPEQFIDILPLVIFVLIFVLFIVSVL